MGARYYEGSFTEAEDLLGLSRNFFSVMKHSQSEKYAYIRSLDTNIIEAYHKYSDEVQALLDACAKMYYDLESNQKIYQFSRLIQEKGLYKNKNGFCTAAPKAIFKIEGAMSFNTFTKYKQIIKIYKENYDKHEV